MKHRTIDNVQICDSLLIYRHKPMDPKFGLYVSENNNKKYRVGNVLLM
jgi:hypothetical protein